MARWTVKGMGITDVTDVPTDVEVVAPDEVRDFVAAHGGRLYVWISVHPGVRCALCLLEATQRMWPKRMEFALRRRVEAYWNGLAWIA